MKVAFITNHSTETGIGKQNHTLINWLKQKWVDVDLIFLCIPSIHKNRPEWKYIKSDIFNNYYASVLLWTMYVFPKKLTKLLKEGWYTHVILSNQSLGYLYHSLKKTGLKITIIIHDLIILHSIREKLLMKNLDKFENLVFISEFTKNDYIKHYGPLKNKNYAVIYQWIDKKAINNKIKEHLKEKYNLKNKTVFLNVWAEYSSKNIITYLELAKKYKENKDLLFVRVWRPSKESSDYISTHKLDNVLYLSWLSNEELFALYSLSKAVISTSTLEWYWRQIFEWYLYSNYVITSDVSDVRNMFDWDNSVHVIENPYDTEKYCEAINKIIKSKEIPIKTKIIPNTLQESENYYNCLKQL